ncbi:MAG: TAXI family TRAP transporter solute-binding subunit [Alphaproteobacteria bacterium]|nr:TAXI family TRAP transporter solute-binding subunit [Alphaproteobacteria bacterium]
MRILAVLLVLAGASHPVAAAGRTLVVGTGEVSGFHYPVGGAICRVVAKDRATHGLRCLVEPSAGSQANLAALKSGDIDMALVQSRVQALAVEGAEGFDQPLDELRALMSLHSESVVVLAGPNGPIRSLADLKGRKVNLGRPGSFQRAMADELLKGLGWTAATLGAAMEIEAGSQLRALCEGRTEAVIVTAVHPAPEIRRAIAECGARLVDMGGPAVAKVTAARPWLAAATIPAAAYGTKGDVETFGTRATLVATTRLSEPDAYALVKAVLENLEPFGAMLPLLGQLDRDGMAVDGLTAPLHEGAARYFREAGLAP